MSISVDKAKRLDYSLLMMNTANRAQRATDRNRDNELNANGSGCLFGGSAALKADSIQKGAKTMINHNEAFKNQFSASQWAELTKDSIFTMHVLDCRFMLAEERAAELAKGVRPVKFELCGQESVK